jgi:hypothetical protein
MLCIARYKCVIPLGAFRTKARELDSAMRTVAEECDVTTVERKL